MAVKGFKPTTPGRRTMLVPTFEEITKTTPEKSLTISLKSTGGRNAQGRITTRFRGGGVKRKYRIIDFKRDKDGVPAKVASIEYDPYRTSYIAPVGTTVHNIEMVPGKGGQLARSAGTSAQLMAKEGKYAQLRLPSGEFRLVSIDSKATIGQVGNLSHELVRLGKAGKSRYLGRRPSVRGSAMNPVDHPHGGGEGRAPIGRPSPMTPWGKKAMGLKTRKKNKKSNKYIVRSRKAK